jgi:hypothetical protein
VDPRFEQTEQAYLYAGDDPVNGSDPNGEYAVVGNGCGLPGAPRCKTHHYYTSTGLVYGLEGAVNFIEGFDNSTLQSVDMVIHFATLGNAHINLHLERTFHSSNPYVNWDYTFGGAYGTAYGFATDDLNAKVIGRILDLSSLTKAAEWSGASGVADWMGDFVKNLRVIRYVRALF